LKHGYLIPVVLALFLLCGCAQTPIPAQAVPPSPPALTPAPSPAPAPVPSPEPSAAPRPLTDTMPPSAITALSAADAYDGRVNLCWDKSTAEDFSHYNVYVGESEFADADGKTPVHKIENIGAARYQVTGLDSDKTYYFAVTAVDKSGNEEAQVSAVSAVSTVMPRGTADPDMEVDVYKSEKAWAGTTLLVDNHNQQQPRIIEVNMLGEIIWQYQVPQGLSQYTNPGFDVEWLPDDNILFVLPCKGVYEIDRNGSVVWSYLDKKVSHDADRLPDGNTLMVWGGGDTPSDAQAKEISPDGKVVWSWYARDYFNKPPYSGIQDQGWTHSNAVSRLSNGNTLVSPRNFDLLVEVDPQGKVVRTIGEGVLIGQHDPEVLPGGNILVANHGRPHRIIEMVPETGEIVWQSPGFDQAAAPVRDCNRLPNGNTLITGSTRIVEINPRGEPVWQLKLKMVFQGLEAAQRGFYKAERLSIQR